MISVVIATLDHQRVLGQTLAALVPAAVDGVVRQVIVADGGSTDATLDIAKDSGADVLELTGAAEGRIVQACARARAEWILILDPSIEPPPGWEPAARAHLAKGPDRAAWLAPGRGGLMGGPPRAHGLLISRRLLGQMGGYGPRLTRKLGGRLKRL
jgi:glycosyltransferase involved in cell wall biosynthesis